MRLMNYQLFPIKVFLSMFTLCFLCESTAMSGTHLDDQSVDRVSMTKTIIDELEPCIRSEDFVEFIHRLSLSEDMKEVANKEYEQYKQQAHILKQDIAAELWKAGLSELLGTNGNLDSTNTKEVQEICHKLSKCDQEAIRKLKQHRDDFLEGLNLQLNLDNDTWTNAKMWVRRQSFLRGIQGLSWQDLKSFPDLIDQYERMIQEDEDFHLLSNPDTDLSKEVAEIVQVQLKDWALQTDLFVDTYLIQAAKWRWRERVTIISGDRNGWIAAWKRNRKTQRRRYNLILKSDEIASTIELVVGSWAVERWRQTTRATIFPESCVQNSFEIHYSSLVESGILSGEAKENVEKLVLPQLQKLSQLRSSLCKVALWYSDYLIPKLRGYDVPIFHFNLQDIDEQYLETVDSMLDILSRNLSSEDSLDLRLAVIKSRIQSAYVDHPFSNARGLFVSLSGSESNIE